MQPRKMIILFSLILLLGGCTQIPQDTITPTPLPPETLGDIAYDVNEEFGYTVYIEENDEAVPYLVLTHDYGGNVLLLRQFLLDEYVKYNDYKTYSGFKYHSGYYNGSTIDVYLNETFLPQIDADLQKSIVDTEITITAIVGPGLGGVEKDVEQIIRKVFLLSRTELGYKETYTYCVEGTSLKYFADDYQRRIAYTSTGACPWMLRTPGINAGNSSYGIGPDGVLGGGDTNATSGVRPAFCLPGDLPIYERSLDGETVYFISK